jgi:hypothetical protein
MSVWQRKLLMVARKQREREGERERGREREERKEGGKETGRGGEGWGGEERERLGTRYTPQSHSPNDLYLQLSPTG